MPIVPKNQAEDKGSNFVYRMVKANQIENKTKEINLNYSKFSSNNKTTSNSNKMNNFSSTSQSSMSGRKRKCKGEKIRCCLFLK